nr:MAG TPA: hypothetical protein [Caudoviricetes sp.]
MYNHVNKNSCLLRTAIFIFKLVEFDGFRIRLLIFLNQGLILC